MFMALYHQRLMSKKLHHHYDLTLLFLPIYLLLKNIIYWFFRISAIKLYCNLLAYLNLWVDNI
jgi:hypothetical protein